MLKGLVVLLVSFALLGCEPIQIIGTGDSRCENHPAGVGNDPAVAASVTGLVPPAAQVRCTDSKVFEAEGREVSLVYVAYGDLQDCQAGCFSSHLCAIHDGGNVMLYGASWYAAGERPLSIPPDCPELAAAASGDTLTGCSTPPAGFHHPVTLTAPFESFRQAQLSENGDWRFCFR